MACACVYASVLTHMLGDVGVGVGVLASLLLNRVTLAAGQAMSGVCMCVWQSIFLNM